MRTVQGTVESAKMINTVSVVVHTHAMHPVYKKRFRKSKKFLADTNGQDVHVGDIVTITECRPLSKHKCFKVTEIVQAAPRVDDMADEKDTESALHREKSAPEVEAKEDKAPEQNEDTSTPSTDQ